MDSRELIPMWSGVVCANVWISHLPLPEWLYVIQAVVWLGFAVSYLVLVRSPRRNTNTNEQQER